MVAIERGMALYHCTMQYSKSGISTPPLDSSLCAENDDASKEQPRHLSSPTATCFATSEESDRPPTGLVKRPGIMVILRTASSGGSSTILLSSILVRKLLIQKRVRPTHMKRDLKKYLVAISLSSVSIAVVL